MQYRFDIDSLSLASWRGRPRSFVALMSLYESNYLRLAQLAGPLLKLEGQLTSYVLEDCDVRLSIIERTPYTTVCELTCVLSQEPGDTYPDMRIRIYHDAALVEAHEWSVRHEHETLRRLRAAAERELDQRWARNMMLNKWLEYCMDRGHSFRR
jgi:uncharacterized protein